MVSMGRVFRQLGENGVCLGGFKKTYQIRSFCHNMPENAAQYCKWSSCYKGTLNCDVHLIIDTVTLKAVTMMRFRT